MKFISMEMEHCVDEFIGETFNNGKLKVIGLLEKARYKVTCEVCSPDKELFPLGYFISTKYNLKAGKLPCGCTLYRWDIDQYLVKIKRASEKKKIIVHGFVGEFKGKNTRLSCECPKDQHKWTTSIDNFINSKRLCPKCAGNAKITELEALEKCKTICDKFDYKPLGFLKGYKNNKSYFRYECTKHGVQEVNYNHFVNNGTRCPVCSDESKAESKRLDVSHVIKQCLRICEEENYTFAGFPNEYKSCSSHFDYICHTHGLQTTTYGSFVYGNRRCRECNNDLKKLLGVVNGWYPERAEETDFLYVLNFNDQFIKIGRSFNLDERIKDLKTASGIDNITKLRIFTASHKDVYNFEQELHQELGERNFRYYVPWTTECFEKDSLPALYKYLDICGYIEILQRED